MESFSPLDYLKQTLGFRILCWWPTLIRQTQLLHHRVTTISSNSIPLDPHLEYSWIHYLLALMNKMAVLPPLLC